MSPAENVAFAVGIGVMNAGLGAEAMIVVNDQQPAWPVALVFGGIGLAWATMRPNRKKGGS